MDNAISITANEVRTHVICEGHGRPIVMLHGWAATSECWKLNIEALRSNYQVIAPDLPGHGNTEGGMRRYDLDFYVGWLRDLLDQLGVEQTVLIGNSLGGAIILAFALAYPDRVTHLVLVDVLGASGKIPFSTARLVALRLPYLIGVVLNWRFTTSILNYVRGMVFVDPLEQQEIIVDMARANAKQGFWYIWSGLRVLVGDFLLRSKGRDFAKRLSTITVPTLIVWGRHDGLIPVSHAYAAAENMPAAQLEIFEDSAHLPFLEEPEGFNKMLKEFLRPSKKKTNSPQRRRGRKGKQ